MADKYTSDHFAAFLVYAGSPPEMTRYKMQKDLSERLDYIGKCDEFCQQYFGAPPRTGGTVKLHVEEDWVEFYSAFIKWCRIRQEMQNEIDSGRQGVPAEQQDT